MVDAGSNTYFLNGEASFGVEMAKGNIISLYVAILLQIGHPNSCYLYEWEKYWNTDMFTVTSSFALSLELGNLGNVLLLSSVVAMKGPKSRI